MSVEAKIVIKLICILFCSYSHNVCLEGLASTHEENRWNLRGKTVNVKVEMTFFMILLLLRDRIYLNMAFPHPLPPYSSHNLITS
jgi:hypothetical protein